MTRTTSFLLGTSLLAALAACGGNSDQAAGGDSAATTGGATSAAPAAGGEQTPDAGGKVIEIEMLTDDQGNNIFRPADFEANKGDVLRYKLISGVHNVHFLPDSNPGKSGLPAASDMLQLNGQTVDYKVTWDAGRYYYQCDPHALLGMIGHVTVK